MNERTNLPWVIEFNFLGVGDDVVLDAQDQIILRFGEKQLPTIKLSVRAMNSHDDMIVTLKTIGSALADDDEQLALRLIDAALKKAGEPE